MPLRRLLPLLATLLLGACTHATKPVPPPAAPPPVKLKIGLALGGGAAKGFAYIGVIKMLEASGIHPDVVAGTSAGSVVGALYASGMDAFALQQTAFGLDEAKIRDVRLFSGGLVQGQALQDYVNQLLHKQPIEQLKRPFAAVATELETGTRTVFVRGNTGRAVRASSSIPGVFEPVEIHGKHYVDGGVVSPIPVDAARQLGADFVIAVDISAMPDGSNPQDMMGIVGQSITIMGRQLAAQESARADVVIRPDLRGIGPTDFEQKNQAILEGEKAALAAIPAIRTKLAAMVAAHQAAAATVAP
ncbi:patatin-like phospholipase family protein [Rhodanobacter denitrificans]|uniref:patatin-like phospholipase family protein n=1 Tax=Rhodanobacter denitrificans TaxID=666685 RepID=UPI000260E60A|nr:patatin-like phospholipase family protein [Rhodanobacter denitrificans]EIM03150.1 patatin [Rhodanobacter denitrificans]UJM90349.1 patatin-like phospholipase family protein [Rhodanobacter denitrificans]